MHISENCRRYKQQTCTTIRECFYRGKINEITGMLNERRVII